MALYTDWCKKCDEEIKYEYCEPVCLHVYMVIRQNWNVNNMTCNVKKKIKLSRFYMCLCTKLEHKQWLVKKNSMRVMKQELFISYIKRMNNNIRISNEYGSDRNICRDIK